MLMHSYLHDSSCIRCSYLSLLLSFYRSICLFAYSSVSSSVFLSIYLPLCMLICFFFSPSVDLYAFVPTHLSLLLSFCRSICLCAYPFACACTLCLYRHPSVSVFSYLASLFCDLFFPTGPLGPTGCFHFISGWHFIS